MKATKFTRIIAIALVVVITMSLAITAHAEEIPEIVDGTSYIENVKDHTRILMACENDVNEIDFIPLYNQRDYADVGYGAGNISDGGCGLVSVWMVATYQNNTIYDIDELAKQFGNDYYIKGQGSLWSLFVGSSDALNLNLIKSDCPNGEWYDWDMVIDALENGQPVVCLQRKGIFTSGGHFIVLTGITDDGKIIVNDPNGLNWEKNATMKDGFDDGFDPCQIRAAAVAYWIYGEKVVEKDV